MKYESVGQFLEEVAQRNPGQPEFLQAVTEVMESLWPFIEKNPKYAEHALLERLVEPERIIQFRVSWTDDKGQVQVNRGFRIQHSMAIGPFKGGLRFRGHLFDDAQVSRCRGIRLSPPLLPAFKGCQRNMVGCRKGLLRHFQAFTQAANIGYMHHMYLGVF